MILHCMSVFYVFSYYSSTRFFRDLASAFIDVLILSITFWISVASSLIFVFKSLVVGRKYLWVLENLSYWSAYFCAYISSRSSKLWPWCSFIMDHFQHNEILHYLQKNINVSCWMKTAFLHRKLMFAVSVKDNVMKFGFWTLHMLVPAMLTQW